VGQGERERALYDHERCDAHAKAAKAESQLAREQDRIAIERATLNETVKRERAAHTAETTRLTEVLTAMNDEAAGRRAHVESLERRLDQRIAGDDSAPDTRTPGQ